MSRELFRLDDDLEFDLRSYELRRSGQPLKLERIPMELLRLFIEHRGRLVTRDEIIERIWGKDVFLDTDNSINAAIRKIRQALKDDPVRPRFLQTVVGKGYRFVGTIEDISSNREDSNSQQDGNGAADVMLPSLSLAEQPPHISRANKLKHLLSRRYLWASIAGALLGLVLIAWQIRPRDRETSKTMLVVLPFNNLSGDPGQDYFADGMTEEMITQLGSLNPERLGVIARVSAMRYRHSDKSAGQIARELGVSYLLEGSVRRSGSRVRVTAQLIQGGDQTHLWAQEYDRDISDALQLQSEIAQTIAKQIQVALSEQVRAQLSSKPQVNEEAYDEYLQGLQSLSLRTPESERAAIQHLERATDIDPTYALAYAAKARCYGLLPIFGGMKPDEAMRKARAAAERAIELDGSLAEAHTALAFVEAHYEYDWPRAEREFKRAIELNPSDPMAHLFYSNSYLSPRGRHDGAIAEMGKAISLDPYSQVIQSFLIRTYTWAHRWREAEAQFHTVNALNPNFAIDHSRMARLCAYSGRYETAIDEDVEARVLSGENPDEAIAKDNRIRRAVARNGTRGYWATLLEFSRDKKNPPEAYVTPFGIAILYAQLGDRDNAFAWLNRAYQERDVFLTELAIEPGLDPLHEDPRYTNLLQRIGLP